jgi:hypothetical protein
VEWWILYIILAVIIALLVVAYFILKKKMGQKLDAQKELVDQHKVSASILILEKRMDKVKNANLPKGIIDQIPKIYKIRKVPIVKAKIGAQVMDLLCEEEVFDKLPEKKTVKVDIAGIFIAGMSKGGGKSKR